MNMTILPPETGAVAVDPKKGIFGRFRRKKAPKPVEPNVITFEASRVRTDGLKSNVLINRHGEKQEGMKSNELGIPESVRYQHEIFLTSYINGLKKIVDSNDKHILFNDPTRAKDLAMWNALTTNDIPDKAKIKAFIEQPEGLTTSLQAMEEAIGYTDLALGMVASLSPEGNKMTIPSTASIPTGIDHGPLRGPLDKLGQLLDNPVWFPGQRYGRGLLGKITWKGLIKTGVGAALGGSPYVSAAAGIPMWASFPGLMGIEVAGITATYLFRGGVMLKLNRSKDAFSVLKNGTNNDKLFMKYMTGIDVDQWEFKRDILGVERFQVDKTYLEANPSAVNVEERKMDALSLIYTRIATLKSLGAEETNIDAGPTQSLIEKTTIPEKTGLDYQEKVWNLYKQGGIPTTVDARIKKWQEANATIMIENLEKLYDTVPSLDDKRANGIKNLNEAKVNLQNETSEQRRKRVEAIVKEREGLETDTKKIEEYSPKFKALEDKAAELRDAEDAQNKLLTNITMAGAGGTFTNVDAAIMALENALNVPGAKVKIGGTDLGDFAGQEAAISARHAARISTPALVPGTPPPIPPRKDQIEASEVIRRQEKQALVDDVKAHVQSVKEKLEKLKAEVELKRKALSGNEEVAEVNRTYGKIEKDYADILSWRSATGVAIVDEATLEAVADGTYDPTLGRAVTVEDILNRINTANAGNPAVGWSAERNEIERIRVEHALIESQAKRLYEVSLPALSPTLTNAFDLGITETEIRAMSTEQLFNKMNNLRAIVVPPLPPLPDTPGNRAILGAVITEAKNRLPEKLAAAQTAISIRKMIIKEQVDELNWREKSVKVDEDVNKIDSALVLMERQQPIMSGAGNFIGRMSRVTNFNTAPTGDTFTHEELRLGVSGVPRGYLEFMDYLFHYRDRTDRDTYLKNMSSSLSPDRLAGFLNDYISAPPATLNINTVLAQFYTDITGVPPAINEIKMRRALKKIIDSSRDSTLASFAA